MVGIFDPVVKWCLPWTKELYLCTFAPLPSLCDVQYLQTMCGCGGGGEGGGVLNCAVDHILQEFYALLLTRFRTYKIASPPQTKMTSKDDIKGLVSLKFFRPWVLGSAGNRAVMGGGGGGLGITLSGPTRFYSRFRTDIWRRRERFFLHLGCLFHAEIQRESTAGRERVKAIFVRERASVTSIYCQQAREYT